jgi:hypothetical protein
VSHLLACSMKGGSSCVGTQDVGSTLVLTVHLINTYSNYQVNICVFQIGILCKYFSDISLEKQCRPT